MISESISDDYDNMVIPILSTSAVSFHIGALQAARPNYFRQYIAGYTSCGKFLTLSNQMSHYIASALECVISPTSTLFALRKSNPTSIVFLLSCKCRPFS